MVASEITGSARSTNYHQFANNITKFPSPSGITDLHYTKLMFNFWQWWPWSAPRNADNVEKTMYKSTRILQQFTEFYEKLPISRKAVISRSLSHPRNWKIGSALFITCVTK